jgi:hypothetical protein
VTQHGPDEILDAACDGLKSSLACARYKSLHNAAEVHGLTSTTIMRRLTDRKNALAASYFCAFKAADTE